MKVLKNAPWEAPSSISISEDSPEWEKAYANWRNMKNPTKSPEWKKGIFLGEIPTSILARIRFFNRKIWRVLTRLANPYTVSVEQISKGETE